MDDMDPTADNLPVTPEEDEAFRNMTAQEIYDDLGNPPTIPGMFVEELDVEDASDGNYNNPDA